MITIGNYVKAESLQQAWELNQKKSSRILGGMLWLKLGRGRIGTAIDLSGLGLDTVEETESEFSIGAMATLRQLELHEGLNAFTGGAVKAAVKDIVGVQFRNMATVGGSLWGRFGFSDVLSVFLALDSYVELYKGGIVPLREFAKMPYDRDILVRLIVKKEAVQCVYQSVRITKTDFPVLTCAAAKREGGWRFVYGARPGRAVCLDLPSDKTAEELSDIAADTVTVGSNVRGSAAYRQKLVKTLTRRGAEALGGGKTC
jgi:CO/xanthine dehydrogenase FAD-binding subunit